MDLNKLTSTCLLLILCSGSNAHAAEAIPVTTQRLGDLLVDTERRAPAVVISANRADITSQVSAIIQEVLRDVGANVKKGELLIRLDNANARNSLAQAHSSLDAIDAQILEAKSRVAKAEELLGKDFISDEELVARRANLAVLEANRSGQLVAVNIAELELARTRITAPFDAAIIARAAQVGSYAQPGTPLITLVQTDSREIDVELDPRYAVEIPSVSNIRFVSQDIVWPVKLARLSAVIDIATRVVHARFLFTQDVAPIGTSGQLVWSESSDVVPVALIVQRGSELGVFIAENDTAKFIVIPSAEEGRPASVNLPPETLIVSRGHVRLQDGDTLKVTHE